MRGAGGGRGGRGQGRGRGAGRGYGGLLSPRAYRHGGGVASENLPRAMETHQIPLVAPSSPHGEDKSVPPQAKPAPALVAVVARPDDCILCGVCVDACPSGAMALGDVVVIDEDLCTACGVCVNICPNDVLEMVER